MNKTLNMTQKWDKTFPKSEKVNHRKVTFHNRYGITLAADLYEPKNAFGKLAAIADYKNGSYALGGGVVDPLPEDAPFFVADYYDYYKTGRGYHERSLNSNGGWNVIGCMSFINQPILQYIDEIRSAVLVMHGEKAHSCYFSRDAYAAMVKDNPYADNKELLIIPDAIHTDLYDGGGKDAIPFDKLDRFFRKHLNFAVL